MKYYLQLTTLLLATSLTACGGDSSDSSPNTKITSPSLPTNIQGYYETIFKADNGDDIALTLAVKPNGEYFGNINNYLGNSTSYDKEIYSIYSGTLSKENNQNQLKTLITEFDDADEAKTIRKYSVSGNYTPKQKIQLDFTGIDSSIDKKAYTLNYIDFDGLPLNDFSGTYSSAISQIAFKYMISPLTISNTPLTNQKSITLAYSKNCQFNGTITDNHYDAKFYDFKGSLKGGACPSNNTFHGITYVLNNTFILIGTNKDKTQEFRIAKLGFKN